MSTAASFTYFSGFRNSSTWLNTSFIKAEVASGENNCVPASKAIAAATHGIAKPLLCLVTMWLPLNIPGPPPP